MQNYRQRFATFMKSHGFAAVLCLLFLFLLFRNMGLYPVIFSDEESYSSMARTLPLSEALVPSYLYARIFRATSACGDGFLECARALNAVIFVLSAPFIYLIGRRAMSRPLAATAAFLSIAGPASIYTWYFMPEATYFFGFSVLSWQALRYHERPGALNAALLGILLGLLALIKVHAVFLIPGLVCFLVFVAATRTPRQTPVAIVREVVLATLVFVTLAAMVRFSLGGLLAGKAGLSLFGPFYQNQAGNTGAARADLGTLFGLALINTKGHAMSLAALFAVPIASMLLWRPGQQTVEGTESAIKGIFAYGLIMLITMVGVTVAFTASISSGAHESIGRLHMRYYDFVLPFLVLFAASQVQGVRLRPALWTKLAIALPLAALVLYTRLALLPAFAPAIVDSPSVHGLSMNPAIFSLLTALALVTLAAWVVNPRNGARLFVFLFLPVYVTGSAWALSRQMHYAIYADQYVSAGRFTHNYLTPAQTDNLTIVTDDDGGLYKARFYIDNPHTKLQSTPAGSTIDAKASALARGWMLIIGKFATPPGTITAMETPQYKLVRFVAPKNGPYAVNLPGDLVDERLVRTSGFAGPEGFGRWTEGKRVELEFAAPLPAGFTLRLTARAYGPNAGKDFIVRLGDEQKSFRLPQDLRQIELKFTNPTAAKLLTIDIPQPISPEQTGEGPDKRMLGMAISAMSITEDAAVTSAAK